MLTLLQNGLQKLMKINNMNTKIINFRELNKILGLKNTVYSNRIPKKHKDKINELFEFISKWIEKNKRAA